MIEGAATAGRAAAVESRSGTARYEAMSEKQIAREIKRLEKQMHDYARNSSSKKPPRPARLAELRRSVFGASPRTLRAVG